MMLREHFMDETTQNLGATSTLNKNRPIYTKSWQYNTIKVHMQKEHHPLSNESRKKLRKGYYINKLQYILVLVCSFNT